MIEELTRINWTESVAHNTLVYSFAGIESTHSCVNERADCVYSVIRFRDVPDLYATIRRRIHEYISDDGPRGVLRARTVGPALYRYTAIPTEGVVDACVAKITTPEFSLDSAMELFKTSDSPMVCYVHRDTVYTVATHRYIDGLTFHALHVCMFGCTAPDIVPTVTYVPVINELVHSPGCIVPAYDVLTYKRTLRMTRVFPEPFLHMGDDHILVQEMKHLKSFVSTITPKWSFSQTCVLISALYMLRSTSLDRSLIGFVGGFKSTQYKRFNNFAVMGLFITRPPGYDQMDTRDQMIHLINEIVDGFRAAQSQTLMSYGLLTVQGMNFKLNTKIDAMVSICPPYGTVDGIECLTTACSCTSMPIYFGYAAMGENCCVSRTIRSPDIDPSVTVHDIMREVSDM